MQPPLLTAAYAGVFGLLLLLLSVLVVIGRFQFGALQGDGGSPVLARRIRAQANLAEYIPLILLLAALLEVQGVGRATLHALLAPLLVARLIHPFGLFTPADSPQQYLLRGLPIFVTFTVLGVASILLLLRALG